MKKLIFIAGLLASTSCFAWGPYGPYGPGFGYGGYGYPYGMMGAMGYGWGIQAPSFNYNTVIQQSPPIIVNNNDVAPQPQQPQVIYKYKPCDDECVHRYYSK